MSVTFGFYNSKNKDRVYNTEQVSSIFDGIISDGVYQGVPENKEDPNNKYYFKVRSGTGMQIIVGPGRAWFNHTWTLNDNDLPLDVKTAPVASTRVDAVVLKVDRSTEVRANSIYVHEGPISEPNELVYPEFENTDDVSYHILAYIIIDSRTTQITNDMIENVVGTDKTPFVAGVVNQISVSSLLTQWSAQWERFVIDEQYEWDTAKEEWLAYLEQTKADYEYLFNESSKEIQEFISSFKNWADSSEVSFYEWFSNLRNQLDDNQASHLQAEIDDLRTAIIPGSNSLSNVGMDDSGHITSIATSYIDSQSTTVFSYENGIHTIEKHFINSTLEYRLVVSYDGTIMTKTYIYISGDPEEFDTLVNTEAVVTLDSSGFIARMDVTGDDDYERHIAFQNTKYTSTVTDIVSGEYSASAVYNKTAQTISTSRQIGGQ